MHHEQHTATDKKAKKIPEADDRYSREVLMLVCACFGSPGNLFL